MARPPSQPLPLSVLLQRSALAINCHRSSHPGDKIRKQCCSHEILFSIPIKRLPRGSLRAFASRAWSPPPKVLAMLLKENEQDMEEVTLDYFA